MIEYLQANQKRWDQLTLEHEKSTFYDLAGFKAGKDRLRSIELTERAYFFLKSRSGMKRAGRIPPMTGGKPMCLTSRAKIAFMEQGEDGWRRLPAHQHGIIPFLFSLQARKLV